MASLAARSSSRARASRNSASAYEVDSTEVTLFESGFSALRAVGVDGVDGVRLSDEDKPRSVRGETEEDMLGKKLLVGRAMMHHLIAGVRPLVVLLRLVVLARPLPRSRFPDVSFFFTESRSRNTEVTVCSPYALGRLQCNLASSPSRT